VTKMSAAAGVASAVIPQRTRHNTRERVTREQAASLESGLKDNPTRWPSLRAGKQLVRIRELQQGNRRLQIP